jgi:two-component system, NtrC family, response regulator HydG
VGETAFILIVEGDPSHGESMAEELRQQGHACRVVQSGGEAVDSISTRRPDVIVADEALAGDGRAGLIREAGQLAPDAEIVLLTSGDGQRPTRGATGSAEPAAVFRIVPKPTSLDQIRDIIATAAEQAIHNRQRRALQEQADRRFEFEGMVTANSQMERIINTLRRVADSKLTVLILGESGTGKELAARAIHRHSPRRSKAYRAINCAGLNENLLESELFGHVKGAFTGAVADRKGLFEVVDGGTLFLDEVGDMPLPMQAKLLRTLENGEILPVGSTEIRRVDVRVVAATRRDLRAMIEAKEFRDDLFYRLHQATIRLPSLRERRDDIPLLVEFFLREACKIHDKQVESITPEAVRRLTSYSWPGNIRELRSVIDVMVVVADHAQLDVDDLPESIRGSTEIVLATPSSTAGLTMEQMERIHIANTLKLTGGNREKTAKILGIGARTLYRKLREYGL